MSLKPNYGKYEISANYKIMHASGSGYFEDKTSKGVHELLINGFTIRFIPTYNERKYSFPPDINILIDSHNSELACSSINEFRMYSFFQSDVVFYSNDLLKDTSVEYKFDTNHSEEINPRNGESCLIICVGKEEFNKRIRQMRTTLPYIGHQRNLSLIRHNDIADLSIIKFLDNAFKKYSDKLPAKFRESIEL